MAKKKTKNTGALIWPVATLLLGGALLGLLALPFMTIDLIGSSKSGWEFIDFSEGAPTGCAIVLLLLVIFTCLMMVLSIVKILNCIGIIKDSKIVNLLLVICGLIVAILAIVNIITISTYVADPFNLDSDFVSNITSEVVSTGWAGLIVNAVVGVCAFVTSLFSSKK